MAYGATALAVKLPSVKPKPHDFSEHGVRVILSIGASVHKRANVCKYDATAWLSSWSQAPSMKTEQAEAGVAGEKLAAPLFALGQLLPDMLRLFAE
jgi:hypothetical protein